MGGKLSAQQGQKVEKKTGIGRRRRRTQKWANRGGEQNGPRSGEERGGGERQAGGLRKEHDRANQGGEPPFPYNI